MTIDLHKWTSADREELMALCNAVDRTFLSDRLPYPYTGADADWWLGMVAENDGKEGVWRAIVVDNQIVGSISVERIADKSHAVGSIGYMILTPFWSQGIGPGAGEEWLPAGGNEGRGRGEGRESDGCAGIRQGFLLIHHSGNSRTFVKILYSGVRSLYGFDGATDFVSNW